MTDTSICTQHDFGKQAYFVFADHASNRVPPELDNLGLPDAVLETHIAWDIGAKALALGIGKKLGGTVQNCNFSRLVIDSNRDPAVAESIPATSDQIPVPGNQMLSEKQRAARISDYFDPYHKKLGTAIEQIGVSPRAFIVSVHSFTRRMNGAAEDRPWDVGLLWREDEASAQAMMQWLREHSGWQVGDNQPYDARTYNYSVDRHVGPLGLRHLTFEVRQDHLATPAKVAHAAELLATAIAHVARSGE